MKKIYILLVICMNLPSSIFASVNTNETIIQNGTECMSAQTQCTGG
jgi:hypothetical protein